jgi:hypothetical protein
MLSWCQDLPQAADGRKMSIFARQFLQRSGCSQNVETKVGSNEESQSSSESVSGMIACVLYHLWLTMLIVLLIYLSIRFVCHLNVVSFCIVMCSVNNNCHLFVCIVVCDMNECPKKKITFSLV